MERDGGKLRVLKKSSGNGHMLYSSTNNCALVTTEKYYTGTEQWGGGGHFGT
jgi:phage gpG-like protein